MNKFYKGMCLTLSTMMVLSPLSTFALSKDETVYAKLNSNGTLKKVVVTEHLTNTEASNTINDMSSLKDIKNVNGSETFTSDGNKLTWTANGNDIYYQGSSDEELPIGVSVTYQLNGKEMKASKMVGKKGHVVMTIKYINNLATKVNGNTLYTPFVVATETSIATKNNSNVTVTNGKVVSTGTNNIVAAISSPGLYESLNVNALKGLDTVTIEYDTTKFSKGTIYSVATSKLLEESDFDSLNDIDSIYAQVNTLSNAADQIVSGSKQILDGTTQLSDGSLQLVNAAKGAYEGSLQIKAAVDASIKTTENDKSNALSDEQVNGIALQAKNEAVLTDAQKQYISNQAKTKVDETVATSIAQLEANHVDQLVSVCSMTTIPTGYEDTCSANAEYIAKYVSLKNPVTVAFMEASAETAAVTAAESAAQTAAEATAKTVAPEVANQVKTAATTKTVTSLKLLSDNLGTLSTGLKTLGDGTNTLNNGVITLTAGSKNLYDGATQFNETGIKKISNLVNGTLKNKVSTVKELTKLSNKYDSYASKNSDTEGNTKFIMITK